MKQLRHFVSLLPLVCFGFLTEPVFAETISFNFTGTVTSVSGAPLGLSAGIGDLVTGSITYDTSLPPAYNTGSVAGYIQPPPSGMSVVIGGATVQSAGNASLQMLNNAFGVDNFNGFFAQILVNGTLQPSDGFHTVSFGFSDMNQTAFSSTLLPTFLNVGIFTSLGGGISAGVGISVIFSIDTLQKQNAEIPVKIDIKPGSFPNSINVKAQGKIPVAILTTGPSDNVPSFDVSTVDPASVRFGTIGTEASPVSATLTDVDRDGDADLILHFKTQDTGIRCGDVSALLRGETFEGKEITGKDSIRTIECKIKHQ